MYVGKCGKWKSYNGKFAAPLEHKVSTEILCRLNFRVQREWIHFRSGHDIVVLLWFMASDCLCLEQYHGDGNNYTVVQ